MAAGKSAALAALERLGAATLSSDAVVHELLGSPELHDLLRERLGADVIRDGEVDRAAVGRAVFGSEEDRRWLEGVLWPRVATRIGAWYEQLASAGPPPVAAVVEVPLLFEAGMAETFDATIAVIAADSVRDERAAERGHAAVAERDALQLPQSEKAGRADHVVANDGTLEQLEERLTTVLAAISGG